MDIDSSFFGRIVVEFKEKGQSVFNYKPDWDNIKWIGVPSDIE